MTLEASMERQDDATRLRELSITSPLWSARLALLSHPTALRMARDLDPCGPLGIGPSQEPFWKGFKHDYGRKDSTVDFLFRVKKKHPEKIALVQVGDFYETWGVDSVFLVEHCGLNRMGKRGPRAGTPLPNIQAILDGLTRAGFSVTVCEQTDDLGRPGRKSRFIAEIVTPSSPVYTYGLAMDRKRGDSLFPECPPEFGLAFDARGMTVVEVHPDLRTTWTFEGLTREAAGARLMRYGGRFGRIFCHDNLDERFLDAYNLRHENLVRISGYSPTDFPNRMEELVKIDLSLEADTPFFRARPPSRTRSHAPRPLYLGTANQIGVLPARGVPDLVEHMLPKGSPATARNLVRNFLLNPPPKRVADRLRRTIGALLSTRVPRPPFSVSNPARYVKTLHRGEASPDILRDLFKLSKDFLSCYETALSSGASSGLSVVAHILSMPLEEKLLKKSAASILEILDPVLPEDQDIPSRPRHPKVSERLFEMIEEDFRGRVARTAHPDLEKLYKAVERSAARYEKAVVQNLMPAVKDKLPALSFDVHNKALWLRGPVGTRGAKRTPFCHPVDRHGKPVRDRWSVPIVEQRLGEYKDAVEKARIGVASLLARISKELAPHSLPIVHLTTFSNLMRTLTLHATECRPKGWNLRFESGRKAPHRLLLEDFFPYWMNAQDAVPNSLRLDGTTLLTGQNMAGKSTLIRSSAAVSLLASSGWMFPAEKMTSCEPIDGWFVRTGVHDDPQAGLSAFAVEMLDVTTALRDASASSFILIDELGKGTESRAGHSIAGSVLEHLHRRGIRAIFATHWHELFFNPEIELEGIPKISMEVRRGVHTYKVLPKSDLSSCAFDTALKLGVDREIVDRAEQISAGYPFGPKSEPARASYRASEGASVVSERTTAYRSVPLEGAREALREVAGVPFSEIRYVPPKSRPLLKDVNTSALYVLKTARGFYYVGETDDLLSRIEAHRKDKRKKDFTLIYARIPRGKSLSRKLETKLILKLKSMGFPLLSVEDAKHRHFG